MGPAPDPDPSEGTGVVRMTMRTVSPIRLVLACALALALPAAASRADQAGAEGAAQAVVEQLRAAGYEEFEIVQTAGGRIRIVAIGPISRREIVFNPATGEVLQDLLQPRPLQAPGAEEDETAGQTLAEGAAAGTPRRQQAGGQQADRLLHAPGLGGGTGSKSGLSILGGAADPDSGQGGGQDSGQGGGTAAATIAD